jgi:phosphoenolpyruvate synthase/pyruvate phosphate dikinase
MKMVGFFDEVDPDKCGGKGNNLIALVENHFPIPQGFVVTVDAYSLFRSKMEMPESVKEAITDCYERLVAKSGSRIVAVRSSASAEDTATASFAGQYDTYLDVEGVHSVLEHVVECWRSLHNERSTLYRKMMKVPEESLKMAVVIQKMLAPRSAGVVFTANPYTMDENVMIVESSWGCGENVVSGKVTPDYFEIMKNDTFDIVKKMAGSREAVNEVETDLLEDGGWNKQGPIYSIAEEALKKLCAIAKEIECAFGGPQDIEWALENDCSFSILQSRPLTRFRDT